MSVERRAIMIAIKTVDVRNDFKKVSELVKSGEKVLIARPHNENLVILSEKEYNKLDKARRNEEYLDRIDKSLQNITEGKVVSFTIDELEALETMTPTEAKTFVAKARERQSV